MNNTQKNAKELIINARGQLIGNYGQAILVILVVYFLSILLGSFVNLPSVPTFTSLLFMFLILIIIDLLLGILNFGKDRYFLNFARGVQGLSPADLFLNIKQNADKAIGIKLVYTLATALLEIPRVYIMFTVKMDALEFWTFASAYTLLSSLVIYVLQLFFGLSFYLLADRPDYSVLQILAESNRLMRGNRLRFVAITLRLFPLMLLGSFAFFFGLLWPAAVYSTAVADFYLNLIGEEPFDPLSDKEPEPEPEPDPKSLLLK